MASSSYTQEFLDHCKTQRSLSENTLIAYEQDLRSFFEKFAPHMTLSDIQSKHIISYIDYLREIRELSPATIRRRILCLMGFFKWAVSKGHICYSPFAELEIELKVPKRLPRPVEREALTELFRNSPQLTNLNPSFKSKDGFSTAQVTGLVCKLLTATGVRISELLRLRLRDISGSAMRVRIIGKGNRERTVYVTNEQLRIDFNTYIRWRLDCVERDAFVFVNQNGNRLSEAAFRKRLKTYSKRLQSQEHLTPHRFRHSAATLLIEEGVDIRLVQRLLGHASIATTEIYTKVSDVSLVTALKNADTINSLE